MEPRIAQIETIKAAGYLLKTNMTEVGENNPIPKFWEEVFADGRHKRLQNLQGD